jgi:hypothetical protein
MAASIRARLRALCDTFLAWMDPDHGGGVRCLAEATKIAAALRHQARDATRPLHLLMIT